MINRIRRLLVSQRELMWRLDRIQNALGRIEYRQLKEDKGNNLVDYEFQVSSQWGEDGIIQFLIHMVPVERDIFVEFGVSDYQESNTRFLLQNNNWTGVVFDSSEKNISFIKNDPIYWRHNLKAECAFIDRDNINQLITESGLTGDIGLLSIDIDGNDYWVWEAIECISPRIIICEYNSLFGPRAKVTIPYDRRFQRTHAHYSNLYWGASIAALSALADKKGYLLIGSNRAGNNAFFVRNDVSNGLRASPPEAAYMCAQVREARDRRGKLSFLDRKEGLRAIEELPVYDLDSKETVVLREIVTGIE